MSNMKIHLSDGGELQFKEMGDYSYFEAEIFICPICGQELDINDCEFIGTLEEYKYFKSKGWKPEHGKPRRLYPISITPNA